jgi:hypothetical protein
MTGIAEELHQIAQPVVTALAMVDAVVGVVCFGSYALGTADSASDVDLYVLCEPTLIPESTRRTLFERLPGVSELHLHHRTPGWENAWSPQSDQLKVAQMTFDLSYNTQSWVASVVHRVLTQGTLSLPEMSFRPYTLLGLFAQAIPLYDPHEQVSVIRAKLSPYPAALKVNLIKEHLSIMRDSLVELHDYARRQIGPGTFLFQLGRVCDAMVSILYAFNEHYDPATKRPEHELSKLAVLPDQFVARFIRLLEGPFDPQGRQRVVDELAILVEEVTQIAHRALA